MNNNIISMDNIKKSFNETSTGTTSITLIEKFNISRLYKHIYSSNCDLDYSRSLNKYINESKYDNNDNNKINITYIYEDIGRMKAIKHIYDRQRNIKSNITMCSAMLQKSYTRYHCYREIYDDIDISNCSSTLLCQFAKSHNIQVDDIEKYNNKRDYYLNKMMTKNKLNRSDVKKILLSINFDKYESTITKLNNLKYVPKQIHFYFENMMIVRTKLLKQYPKFLKYAREKIAMRNNDINKKQYENLEGSAYAYLSQTLERICILNIHKFITNHHAKYSVGALIHDGLFLEKNINYDVNKLILECEDFVFKTLGFSIKLLIKDFNDNHDLKDVISFQDIDENIIHNENDKIIKLNYRFLTKLNDHDEHGYELYNDLEYKTINIVKSYTGSGKTSVIKRLISKYPNANILSLVSRISLADMHSKDLNLKHYQFTKNNDGMNQVYQLDSIQRVVGTNETDFILILDEVASLARHFLNPMASMSANRLKFLQIFRDILNHKNNILTLAVDAGVNDSIYEFLSNLRNKDIPINLFINEYTEIRKTPVSVYYDKQDLLDNIEEKLSKNENMLICSNYNTGFKANVIEYIKKLGVKESEMLIYSSNEGEKRVDTTLWRSKKCIFCTPSIVYGIDSNKFIDHVFGFYFNAPHFDSDMCMQQLNRERMPKTISLYIENRTSKPYKNIDDVYENCQSVIEINYSLGKEKIDNLPILLSTLQSLFMYEEYRKSHHLNLRHHILALLRNKGYSNITHYPRGNIEKIRPIKIIGNKEYLNGLVSKYKNNLIIDEKQITDIGEKLDIYQLPKTTEAIESITDDEIKALHNKITNSSQHMQVFFDNVKFNSVSLYNKFKHDEFYIMNKKDNGDLYLVGDNKHNIYECLSSSPEYKLSLLNKLQKIINPDNIEPINLITKDNFDNIIEHADLDTLMNEIIQLFRIRIKGVHEKTLSSLNCRYMNCLKTILSGIVLSGKDNKSFTYVRDGIKKKKRLNIPIYNLETIEIYQDIQNFKEKIQNSKYIKYDDDYEGLDYYPAK